jgi:hypothetical protein
MPGISFEEICPDASPEAISLLSNFLKYTNRISAQEVKVETKRRPKDSFYTNFYRHYPTYTFSVILFLVIILNFQFLSRNQKDLLLTLISLSCHLLQH